MWETAIKNGSLRILKRLTFSVDLQLMFIAPLFFHFFCFGGVGAEKSSLSSLSSSSPSICPFDDLQHHEKSVYSQNGEDGILLKLFSSLGTTNQYYVELGVEDGKECNTRLLRERYGFSGIMMDGGHEKLDLNLFEEFITIQNILDLFHRYQVPRRFDLLSIDLDLYDWWILAKILGSLEYLPRIIIVEVNPTLGISSTHLRYQFHEINQVPLTVTHPITTNQTMWDLTRYSGANPKAFQLLAQQFGYEMVYCESCGVNCFLVQRDLIPSSCFRRGRTHSSEGDGEEEESMKEVVDPSGDHLPLPHLSYPCFATLANNKQRGHPPDMNSGGRTPLFVDPRLLTLATTDRLSRLEPSVAVADLEQNMYPPIRQHKSLPFQSLFVNQIPLVPAVTSLVDQLTPEAQLVSFLHQVDEMITRVSDEKRTLVNTKTFLYLDYCVELNQQSLLHQPHSHTNCGEITESYAQLIAHHLIQSSTRPHGENFPLFRNIIEQLLSRGLFFTPHDPFLLTLQRYVSLSHRLTRNITSTPTKELRRDSDGLGESRYAHSLQSVITPQGIEFHISLGMSVCDSPFHQATRLTRILQMHESDSSQILALLLNIMKIELFGFTFGDSLISDEWFHKSHPGIILPSVLEAIPPLLRVLFPPQYSKFTPLDTQSHSLISGSEICSRRSSANVILIFDSPLESADSSSSIVKQINHDLIAACGCDFQLLAHLLGDSTGSDPINSFQGGNFRLCLENLLALSHGYLTRSLQEVYSSQVHSSLQEIFQMTLKRNFEVYSSIFFPFTSALWSGPLGATPTATTAPTIQSYRQMKILIPLRHPSLSICLLLEKYQSFRTSALRSGVNEEKVEVLSRDEVEEFYEIYFRSLLNSLRYYSLSESAGSDESQSGIFFYFVDEMGEEERDQVSRSFIAQFHPSFVTTAPFPSRQRAIPIEDTCEANSDQKAPEWILRCYRLLRASSSDSHQQNHLLQLTMEVRRLLDECSLPVSS
jgi:hypothetical protein